MGRDATLDLEMLRPGEGFFLLGMFEFDVSLANLPKGDDRGFLISRVDERLVDPLMICLALLVAT